MSSSSQEDNNNDLEVVERDPSGRYVRYNKILGQGMTKKVYMGFDGVDCIEIAWSKTELTELIVRDKTYLETLSAEANLLKPLEHENIMRCYDSWIDCDKNDKKTIHMITEIFSSGNLMEYINKHNIGADNSKAIKNWSRQILKGLDYLHSHIRPIIHRDIKCENIFVNGNTGSVKLGDFGLAMVFKEDYRKLKYGTPRFMAPEHIRGNYNQLADIYSFGMCILQMVTREHPYMECGDKDELYKMVLFGKKPAALNRVTDPEVLKFIKKCLAPASNRPTAIALLNDPFLAQSVSSTITAGSSQSPRESVCDQVARLLYRICQGPQQRGESENEGHRQQEQEQREGSEKRENEAQRQQEEGQQREGEDTT